MSLVQDQVTQLQSKSRACRCDTTKCGCSLGVWKAAFWKLLDTGKLQYEQWELKVQEMSESLPGANSKSEDKANPSVQEVGMMTGRRSVTCLI